MVNIWSILDPLINAIERWIKNGSSVDHKLDSAIYLVLKITVSAQALPKGTVSTQALSKVTVSTRTL